MTGFPSFLWLNNILLCVCMWKIYIYIYISHLLYPFIYWQILRLFLYPGYCELCCNQHGGADIFSISCFHVFWIYTPKWDCWNIVSSTFNFLRNLHTVSIFAEPITLLPTVYKGSLFYTTWPTPVISCLFENSHYNRY